MAREHITGSLNGWAPISNTVVDRIIGYVPEFTDIDGDENASTDDDVNMMNLVGSDLVVNSKLDNLPAQYEPGILRLTSSAMSSLNIK